MPANLENSAVDTELEKVFSFQSQRKAMPKNAQTTSQLHSFHTLAKSMETVTDFILVGSKITADGDCSHEIKRCLLLGRKAMTNLDSILKTRDITLPTKGPSSQSYAFSSGHVWM